MFEIWKVYRNSGRLDSPVDSKQFETIRDARNYIWELTGGNEILEMDYSIENSESVDKKHELQIHNEFHSVPQWNCKFCNESK